MKTSTKVLAILSFILSLTGAAAPNGTDVLHFAYELTRHGARSPTESEAYTVGPNMLTPEGMRQRFLLGTLNRKRYTEDYKLIDLEGDLFSQVTMKSTAVNRTMQSGYAELMGMFPPANSSSHALR